MSSIRCATDALPDIADLCARLTMGGVVLGAAYSCGPYTPAVNATGHAFAVLHLTGAPVYLAHDAFEAARALRAAEGSPDLYPPGGPPAEQPTDRYLVTLARWERWAHGYRWREGFAEPEYPREEGRP